MWRKKYALLIAIFLMIPTQLLAGSAGRDYIYEGITGNLPPATGDWIITQVTVVDSTSVIVNGSIIIKSGGALVVINSTIYMNPAYAGQYNITVELGGNLTLRYSKLTSYSGAKYFIVIESGAYFYAYRSRIASIGVGEGIYSGLWIGASNIRMEHIYIYNAYVGLMLSGVTNVMIYNLTVSNYRLGLRIWGASRINITLADLRSEISSESAYILNMDDSILNNFLVYGNMYVTGGSNNNTISGLRLYYGEFRVSYTSNTTIINANIVGGGIYMVDSFDNQIINSNTNGAPIFYSEGTVGGTIQGTYGQIILVECSGYTIQNMAFSGVPVAVELIKTNNTLIQNISVINSREGVAIWGSTGNTIKNSDFNDTQIGVGLYGEGTSSNMIYLNTFSNSSAYDGGYGAPTINYFDNGTHGNYWSDYTGADTNGDGIGDTYYYIDNNSWDRYPLIYSPSLYSLTIPDVDFDGIPNIVEKTTTYTYWVNDPSNVSTVTGTNPWLPDTDGDGLLDGEEYKLQLNPLDPDTDGDGLLDSQETMVKGLNTYPSDPHIYDTDGDGLSDGEEALIYNTNPSMVDTDSDNLTDYEEIYVYGTSPTKADTDGDGFSDCVELQAGTDPLNPASFPARSQEDLEGTTGVNTPSTVFLAIGYLGLIVLVSLLIKIRNPSKDEDPSDESRI